MKTTTLKQIAQVLDLNISTVSRALKNHPDISLVTRRKVQEVAETLDYEPNQAAINLRTKDSKLMGVILPSISNLFYNSFIAALEEDCRRNDYTLMILQSGDDPETEISNLKILKQNRIGGLFICLSPHTKDLLPFLNLKEKEISVIFFDKIPADKNCIKVSVADEKAGRLAAETLIKKKKKKILALFGNMQFSITQKRKSAFENTLNSIKNSITVTDNFYPESSEQAFDILSNTDILKYDTIFCMSDEILVGVMQALQKKNILVPYDISLLAISDGFIPTLYYPNITYVETSGYKLGKLAFSSMIACMGGGSFLQELTTDVALIEGGSL